MPVVFGDPSVANPITLSGQIIPVVDTALKADAAPGGTGRTQRTLAAGNTLRTPHPFGTFRTTCPLDARRALGAFRAAHATRPLDLAVIYPVIATPYPQVAGAFDEKRIALTVAFRRQVVAVPDATTKSHAGPRWSFGTLYTPRTLHATKTLASQRAFSAARAFRTLGSFFTGRPLRPADQAEVHPFASIPEPEVLGVFGDPSVTHRIAGLRKIVMIGNGALEEHAHTRRPARA
jgi:hypothetical protein